MAQRLGRLRAVPQIMRVADCFGFGRDAVKAIDKRYLDETLGPVAPPESGIQPLIAFAKRPRPYSAASSLTAAGRWIQAS